MAPKEDEGRASSHRTDEPEEELTRKEFAILLVRDVAFAGILVAIIFGSMFAYTQVWPPVVVVESGSMQHSHTRAYLGTIDTGDVVLVQAVHSTSDIITYVQGRASGYETYSNYGDVIIFHPPGAPADVTPIIHRAILYADLSASAWRGVDIPSLASFPDPWSATHPDGTPTTNTTGLGSVTLTMRSWAAGFERRESLTYDLRILTKPGFLTKGDHNPSFDGPPGPGVGYHRESPWRAPLVRAHQAHGHADERLLPRGVGRPQGPHEQLGFALDEPRPDPRGDLPRGLWVRVD
ncbi:MAG: S26 family signal peptidase [Methanobacteriota archaeon]|nr:MAG: S26 family signal peptidase [Euryarchaeota archaeon]